MDVLATQGLRRPHTFRKRTNLMRLMNGCWAVSDCYKHSETQLWKPLSSSSGLTQIYKTLTVVMEVLHSLHGQSNHFIKFLYSVHQLADTAFTIFFFLPFQSISISTTSIVLLLGTTFLWWHLSNFCAFYAPALTWCLGALSMVITY